MPIYKHRHRKNKNQSYDNSGKTLPFVFSLTIHCLILIMNFIMNLLASNYHFNNLDNIKNEIYENSPLFEFNIGLSSPSPDYLIYNNFYTWKGTYKITRSGRSNKRKQNINPVQINTIYGNKFFYKKIKIAKKTLKNVVF